MQRKLVIYPGPDRESRQIGKFSNIGQQPPWLTKVPMEGLGVVHVVTELPSHDPGYGFSDVTLALYKGGRLVRHFPITGSVCESAAAPYMHEHWCDLRRLVRCVQGDREALCLLDIDWGRPSGVIERSPEPSDESEGTDPGLTPRVSALIARADSRFVRIPDLGSLAESPLELA